MTLLEVHGHRLYIEDTGGDGPPLVLSHAAARDHEEFADMVEALQDVYRIVTWDQRDAGASTDDELFTAWDAAQDVFAIMDALGIERAVLGGAHEGTDLSLRGALLHPDRVRGLILIDSEVPRDDDDISHRLDELAMPVVVIHGADDAALPAARARALEAAVSDGRGVVAVEGAQGDAHLTHPAQVHEAIRDFLEGLPA